MRKTFLKRPRPLVVPNSFAIMGGGTQARNIVTAAKRDDLHVIRLRCVTILTLVAGHSTRH